jgi:hypothetical protein
MTTRGQTIIGRIFREEDAMRRRALKLAAKTGLPVELRSYTFDGVGRRQKHTGYEGHVMPDGSQLHGTPAKEWIEAHMPEAMPECWKS